MDKQIRLRIAPSPTGEPHVGTAYIAFFNKMFARSRGGKFILRIEDTDQGRSTAQSENAIFDSLRWLGLDWDEGPDVGGPCGPYRQSERLEIYRKHAEELVEKGWAYRCYCTKEELDSLRAAQEKEKRPAVGYFAADSPCRNSAALKEGLPYVIRLKVPDGEPDGEITFFDHIRGKEISRRYSEIDEQVLLKSDGFPTYHLANVVDDHLMGITDVMRGEEWIVSTSKHILLYRAFGWEPPRFYHLSLLRNPDSNKSKISKRKNPVSLRWFRAAGYLPEALLNFLALMGYSRDTEGMTKEEISRMEIFPAKELYREFDPARISSSGPAFDYEKLGVINDVYVQNMPVSDFCRCRNEHLTYLMEEYLGELAPEVKNRFRRFEREISDITGFMFRIKMDYSVDEFLKSKMTIDEISAILGKLKKVFRDAASRLVTAEDFKVFILSLPEKLSADSKQLHMVIRVAVAGCAQSLPLYESMSHVGVYRCINRFEEAALFLKAQPKK